MLIGTFCSKVERLYERILVGQGNCYVANLRRGGSGTDGDYRRWQDLLTAIEPLIRTADDIRGWFDGSKGHVSPDRVADLRRFVKSVKASGLPV